MAPTPTPRKRRIAPVLAAVGLLLSGSALFGAFGFSSVCTRCGAIRDSTEWQIPLTRITIFRTSSEHQTPVSTELLRSGVVSNHEHQWLFSSGGGNGVICAIGEGRHIIPVVESSGVAAILAAGQRFGEVQFRDRLVRFIFDSKTSEAVRVLGLSAPTNGFTDATEYHAWLSREAEFFDDTVRMYRKR